jgi:phospholipase C
MLSVKYWEIIADNLSKAGWSWGVFQPWIAKGEQSGSLTPIATMEGVSSHIRMKS